MVVDAQGRRGFVADKEHGEVAVFDVSGETFTQLAVIPGVLSPSAIAIDDTLQRVFVLTPSPVVAIAAIDIDPDSPSQYTVVGSTSVGAEAAYSVAVDPGSGLVFVNAWSAGVSGVRVVDTTNGTNWPVRSGREPGNVVVDPETHTAYIPSPTDETITSVGPSGVSVHSVVTAVARLAVFPGGVVAATATAHPHLETWDTTTWKRIATSDTLGEIPGDMVIDNDVQIVYTTPVGNSGLSAFRLGSLQREVGVAPGVFFALTLDRSSHRLFASGFEASRVDMFRPNLMPLQSVDRIAGPDRFAVSAGTSEDAFLSGVPVAYIASGSGFADALSGSAAAGELGGPVLLVSTGSIPDSVRSELKRLRPQRIVLLGGEASLSNAVQEELGGFSRSVTRIGGADRYEVSAAVSRATFGNGIDTIYVASGETFPDALSGSAAAGRDKAPILLVRKDEVPAVVKAEIARLNPAHIIVLGGVNTISDDVVAELSSRPTVRVDGADRFAVSAALADHRFPGRAFTVYVASGEVFPDALSAGAAAIENDAPVLLVNHESVPNVVKSVLERLRPYRIVVLGGTNTVSDAVTADLGRYLPG
ncbi:cell wall-binding repeat-containing protein [Herbiconiux sp. P17]|uniref:cell wall-binding repeat-containing protein n=1 Tax=Herbiconiux wuyangfengii TaxID=3342794 RepID=UPI0035B6EF8A